MGVYYDISQTTGRPLEGQAVIPEGSPKLIAALEPLMQGARAALKEDNTLEQSAYYDPNTLTILVNTEHPAHDVFAALAVESVHARMHNQGRNTQYTREAYQRYISGGAAADRKEHRRQHRPHHQSQAAGAAPRSSSIHEIRRCVSLAGEYAVAP